MAALTDYTSYADAMRHFSKDALWALFDGDRQALNIAYECLDRHPRDRVAVRVAHADGRDEAFSFGDLSDGANRVANWLTDRGVRPGDRVAIMLDPSHAFYAALFGAMKAGAVAVPLFTLFGPDGLRLRLDDCTPRLLLLPPDKAALAREVAESNGGLDVTVVGETFFETLSGYPASFAAATGADDMAMYQYTSGTTRELPEAVKHRHRAIVTVMIAALYATGVRPGDRFM
ncbi:MAG: AMP-binding protein, partial [Alphaproteobacteria bacterium]|nr:AMP-binding protein [Alphaproteobacteria bacterium]